MRRSWRNKVGTDSAGYKKDKIGTFGSVRLHGINYSSCRNEDGGKASKRKA